MEVLKKLNKVRKLVVRDIVAFKMVAINFINTMPFLSILCSRHCIVVLKKLERVRKLVVSEIRLLLIKFLLEFQGLNI